MIVPSPVACTRSPIARGALAALVAAVTACSGEADPSSAGKSTGVARAVLDTALCDPARVAAHPSHGGTTIRAALACVACHMPCDDGSTKVTFGALARTDGAAPGRDTYYQYCYLCHGTDH